jgi:hypothetical protein
MASIFITSVTLSRKNYAEYLDFCEEHGCYQIIVNSEHPEGAHAIFQIASSPGSQEVKRVVGSAGKNDEEIDIVWRDNEKPIIMYKIPGKAPKTDIQYGLKII